MYLALKDQVGKNTQAIKDLQNVSADVSKVKEQVNANTIKANANEERIKNVQSQVEVNTDRIKHNTENININKAAIKQNAESNSKY